MPSKAQPIPRTVIQSVSNWSALDSPVSGLADRLLVRGNMGRQPRSCQLSVQQVPADPVSMLRQGRTDAARAALNRIWWRHWRHNANVQMWKVLPQCRQHGFSITVVRADHRLVIATLDCVTVHRHGNIHVCFLFFELPDTAAESPVIRLAPHKCWQQGAILVEAMSTTDQVKSGCRALLAARGGCSAVLRPTPCRAMRTWLAPGQ